MSTYIHLKIEIFWRWLGRSKLRIRSTDYQDYIYVVCYCQGGIKHYLPFLPLCPCRLSVVISYNVNKNACVVYLIYLSMVATWRNICCHIKRGHGRRIQYAVSSCPERFEILTGCTWMLGSSQVFLLVLTSFHCHQFRGSLVMGVETPKNATSIYWSVIRNGRLS